jgi:hypothetical protein
MCENNTVFEVFKRFETVLTMACCSSFDEDDEFMSKFCAVVA